MRLTGMIAAVGCIGLAAGSAIAEVRPAVATNLMMAPNITAGMRLGAQPTAKRSDLGGTGAVVAVAAIAAAGVGVAAAAGAFDHNHDHDSVSP